MSKNILKDPLLHFLVLGGLLFAGSVLWVDDAPQRDSDIVVTQLGQKHLADLFEITWQRAPNADELANLVEEYITEEVYYREALALGLDDDDTIVRRRMRQKLEFMQEDMSALAPPTEAQLQAYFEEHKQAYKTNRILSFRQVLIASHEAEAQDVEAALSALRGGTSPSSLTRSSLLPVSMKQETERAVTGTFGEDFLSQLQGLESGQWHGPIGSGFGTHIVNVSLDQAATPLDFETARAKVTVDYTQALRERSADTYAKNLRAKYRIIVKDAP